MISLQPARRLHTGRRGDHGRALELRPKRRVLHDGDGGVDLVGHVVGAGEHVHAGGGHARGLGGGHQAGLIEPELVGRGQVLQGEPVGEEALGVRVVELGLAQAGLAVGAEADVGVQGQDLAARHGVDRGRVLREVEDAALGPVDVEHALGVLEVRDGAGLAVDEGREAEHVALLPVPDPDLDVGHGGPRGVLAAHGLHRDLVGGVEDGQADRGVGAGVLPGLVRGEVQRAPDDLVQRGQAGGAAVLLLAEALHHAGVARQLGVDPRDALEHEPLGRGQAEHRAQGLEDRVLLAGHAVADQAQQLPEAPRLRELARGHEVLHRLLRAAHGPGHRGLDGPELALALAPHAVVHDAHAGRLVAVQAEAGVGARPHERVEQVDAGAQHGPLVQRPAVDGGLAVAPHRAREARGGAALGLVQGLGQVLGLGCVCPPHGFRPRARAWRLYTWARAIFQGPAPANARR